MSDQAHSDRSDNRIDIRVDVVNRSVINAFLEGEGTRREAKDYPIELNTQQGKLILTPQEADQIGEQLRESAKRHWHWTKPEGAAT